MVYLSASTLRVAALTAALSLLASLAAAHGAHVHGAVKLDVAVETPSFVVEMEAPLDSLLGFEHPPRNAAEKKAAQALIERLQQDHKLLLPDPAAGCTFKSASAESEAFEPGAKVDRKGGAHADLDARFEWTCRNAAAARSIDLGGLLDAFKRIQTIDLQIASPAGQFKQSLKRPQQGVTWGR